MSVEPTTSPTGDTAPIAIVGMACLFPKAGSLGMYWGNIKRGVDANYPETLKRPFRRRWWLLER